MSGHRNDWFPTPVWQFKVENYEQINQKLLQTIYDEHRRDSKGEKWSNVLGWHSVDNLHQRDGFEDFTNIVKNNVMDPASFLNWDLKKFTVNITTCWATINNKFASNSVHNHPNSILSGVYYVKAPKNCGGVFFSDPRPAAQVLVPPVTKFNLWTFPRVTCKPYEGVMLMFPSWLLHGVETSLSAEDRVSLSFNIGMVPIREKVALSARSMST